MHSLLLKRPPHLPPESTSFHIEPPHLPSKLAYPSSQTICECRICKNPKVHDKSKPELELDPFFEDEEESGDMGKNFVFLLKKLIPCKGSIWKGGKEERRKKDQENIIRKSHIRYFF